MLYKVVVMDNVNAINILESAMNKFCPSCKNNSIKLGSILKGGSLRAAECPVCHTKVKLPWLYHIIEGFLSIIVLVIGLYLSFIYWNFYPFFLVILCWFFLTVVLIKVSPLKEKAIKGKKKST